MTPGPNSVTENLTVIPDGDITGGSGTIILDPDNGEIFYSGAVTYKVLFVHGSKTIPQASYPVPPADLKSSFLTQAGQKITFGPVILTVTSLAPGIANVEVFVSGQNVYGVAILDTSGPILQLKSASITASVPVLGNVTLNVQKSA
jgi:hypothetical protein